MPEWMVILCMLWAGFAGYVWGKYGPRKTLGVPLSFTLKSIQQMMGRPTPITWNHRVLLTEEQGEKSYCIHEVHYDEDGSVMGWTQNAIAVFVPSFAELILM